MYEPRGLRRAVPLQTTKCPGRGRAQPAQGAAKRGQMVKKPTRVAEFLFRPLCDSSLHSSGTRPSCVRRGQAALFLHTTRDLKCTVHPPKLSWQMLSPKFSHK